MKTNSSARRIVRIRTIALCLALAALAGMEILAGESMAARIGQTTGQTGNPQAPTMDMSELIAAAGY